MVLHLQATGQPLPARMAELAGPLRRPQKTPANSSVPPAKGYTATRRESAEGERRRGPKEGHRGTRRAAAEADLQMAATGERCDRCGHEVGAAEPRLVERRPGVEIPPIQPLGIEAEISQVEGPTVRAESHGRLSGGGFGPAFGPRRQGLVTSWHEVHHVP